MTHPPIEAFRFLWHCNCRNRLYNVSASTYRNYVSNGQPVNISSWLCMYGNVQICEKIVTKELFLYGIPIPTNTCTRKYSYLYGMGYFSSPDLLPY